MNLFDLFRLSQQSGAKPALQARKSARRILGAHFEWLEPRCLMSVAPPAPIVVEPDNAQYTNFYIAPLLPRGGVQYPSAPQAGQQFHFQPVEEAPSGIVITRGMTDIAPLALNHAHGVPNSIFNGILNNQESRAVREMLSSLQYTPAAPTVEITQPPTFMPFAPTTVPSSPGTSPSLPSNSPSLPAREVSSPSSTPSNTDAPISTSAKRLGRQDAQHDLEGGMVSLVRQPVAQASAFDKVSVAAIDALLEIPAKVDGVQGRFQAFEISVTTESPRPVAPPPARAHIHLPVESPGTVTTPATDPNFQGAWIPPDSDTTIPLHNFFSDDFFSTAFASAAFFNIHDASVAQSAFPFAELPHAAFDSVFDELSSESADNAFSTPRLDIATATLLAAIIGRALWPARAPKPGEQEKTSPSCDAE